MKGRVCIWLGAALLALVTAQAASGADRVYWANQGGMSMSFANLDGSGGADVGTAGSGPAFDPAAGRMYFGNTNKISFINLSGGGGGDLNTSGAVVNGPAGIAIDKAGGRIYWANSGNNTIAYANLDGSGGGGPLNTGGTTVSGPIGVAIDTGARRIYWANSTGPSISFANLDGSGGQTLNTTPATVSTPRGVAIDPATARIYWANYTGPSISSAALNGGSGANLNTPGTTPNNPFGVAIDPGTRRIYWANQGANTIASAALDGSGGSLLNPNGATTFGPSYSVLLEAPAPGEGKPAISGGPGVGQILNCSNAAWADDLPGQQLYRAPEMITHRWTQDGTALSANAQSIGASAVSVYTCTETATNPAGSSSQTSPPFGTFAVRRFKRNDRRGTATFPVLVPGAGTATLSGKGVVMQRLRARPAAAAKVVTKAGTVKLKVRAKGKTKRKLRRTGRAKVTVTIGFTITGGTGGTKAKSLTLKKK